MMLFLEDWRRYPNAIIHYETKNKSALELAAKLRMMGVKNHFFFLALHNPALRDVDPYADNLTVDQMAAIAMECRVNPWYYMREVARAPATSGTEADPVTLNRANVCMWWCFFVHITNILIQPRQTGKSFMSDQLDVCLMNFVCNGTQINLLTKDDKLRAANIARIKNIYEELPQYLKFRGRDDANNTEEFSVNKFKNVYKTYVPQPSVKRALNQGRGMTATITKIDEAPFQINISHSLPVALMAMNDARESAKRKNEPYGILMTTTAGKIDDVDGSYIYDMVEKSAPWTELFYDCVNEADLIETIRRHAPGRVPRVYSAFHYKQLGKSDEWALEIIESANISGQSADRDLFNIWTSGSQSSPLKASTMRFIKEGMREALYNHIFSTGGYIVRWQIPKDELFDYLDKNEVVLGIDTSDASGRDELACVFTCCRTGKVIGVGNYNETNLITFAKFLINLLISIPKLTLIIERRSSAITIIDYLLLVLPKYGIDPYRRMFNWIVNDPLANTDRFDEAKMALARKTEDLFVKNKKAFGFATSGGGQTSRHELYSTTLIEATDRFGNGIQDTVLCQQIFALVDKNGRIDHQDGKRDDLVIAYLLTHWFLTKAKNLQFYGIDPKNILKREVVKVHQTDEEFYDDYEQQLIRTRINELEIAIQTEQNDILSESYIRELKVLSQSLILNEGEDWSLDAFLSGIKESKSRARNIARDYQETRHEDVWKANYSDEYDYVC